MLTRRLADGVRGNRVSVPDEARRAPHILSLGFAGGGMSEGLIGKLAAERIYVAPRLGRMRISPHVYNTESDVDRFAETFRRLVPE